MQVFSKLPYLFDCNSKLALDNINVGAGTVIEYCGKKRTTGTLESLTVDISGYNDISESTDINSITEDLVHSLKGIGEPLSSFTENGITKLPG